MNKFVVTATLIPTNYNRPMSYVVEAESEDSARLIVKDSLRDLGKLNNYVYETKPYTAPPAGKILSTF